MKLFISPVFPTSLPSLPLPDIVLIHAGTPWPASNGAGFGRHLINACRINERSDEKTDEGVLSSRTAWLNQHRVLHGQH